MRYALLIRHGESEANVRSIITNDLNGYPLTENGRKQVEFTARQIGGLHIDRILTSPIQRARETAEIIARSLGKDVTINSGITESDLGRYNNSVMTKLPPGAREELGMESWESHVRRFRNVLDSVSGVWVLVSHALPIRAAISSYLDLNEEESFGIEIRNASVSVIDIDREKVICIGSFLISDRIRKALGT